MSPPSSRRGRQPGCVTPVTTRSSAGPSPVRGIGTAGNRSVTRPLDDRKPVVRSRELPVVTYRLLGPLEVSSDGTVVALGNGIQRELFALLLIDANRTVSVER